MSAKAKQNYKCIIANQNGAQLVCFKISAKELWKVVQIAKRDPDKEIGYQRVLSPSRTKSIADYFDNGNVIPNNILISFDDKVKLSADSSEIIIPNEKSGWVIDGQHRLAGANEAKKDVELVVVAFLNLPIKEQVRQFVTINNEGKGVPTSLLYDLLNYLPPKMSAKDIATERAYDLATKFRKDEDSPFYGRIAIVNSPKKGEVSLTNFIRKIHPIVHREKGKFRLYTFDEQYLILNNYFKSIFQIYPNESDPIDSIFFMTIGFGAMINVLGPVFDYTMKNHNAFRIVDINKILKVVEDFDFDDFRNLGSGSAAEIQAGNDFKVTLDARLMDISTDGSGSIKLI
ncbi:DGQHR domain-containing protein [uncultured Winogradskyella sp.]|uniref:DGQHR domain-containing protein n=1 Tax=uncultured Winogradskyella sp. TaxID=395353 RepID=UPI002604C6FC|nr:DGQHR domain-containing protein [uncultured Winogradskyella sp.]